MKVAGIGLNAKARVDDIVAALQAAGAAGCDGLAVAEQKNDRRLRDAARRLDLPLQAVAPAALAAAAGRAATRSSRLTHLTGGASLAECVALAAAGQGSRLVSPRRVFGHVTVAIAESSLEARS